MTKAVCVLGLSMIVLGAGLITYESVFVARRSGRVLEQLALNVRREPETEREAKVELAPGDFRADGNPYRFVLSATGAHEHGAGMPQVALGVCRLAVLEDDVVVQAWTSELVAAVGIGDARSVTTVPLEGFSLPAGGPYVLRADLVVGEDCDALDVVVKLRSGVMPRSRRLLFGGVGVALFGALLIAAMSLPHRQASGEQERAGV